MIISRRDLLITTAAATGAGLLGSSALAADFRAAAVLPGSITDQAFNQVVYEGLIAARERLGIEVVFSEKVKQADQVSAMSDYARRGYNLVIGAGGEFTAAADRVAKQFPEVLVAVLNGAPTEGVATVNYNNPQFGYILGYIGGKMSKTGKAGMVCGQAIKAFVDIADGFKKGWAKAGAAGDVTLTYTNDLDDVAKAKEATLNLINQGADVVVPYLDNGIVGVVQAAEERGVWVSGLITDLGKSSPKANLASTVLDFAAATASAIEFAKKGELAREDYKFAMGSDAGYMGTINDAVPDALKAEVAEIVDQMRAGTFKL